MSSIPEQLRREVVARAHSRCEYCHLPSAGQVATFPIDHVVSRSNGGLTVLENLALACPHCNGHKWSFISATDPDTGDVVSLFNPRRDTWHDHFEWSVEGLELRGKTPVVAPRFRGSNSMPRR